MAVLVVADHENGEIRPGAASVVTAAQALDSDVHLLVAASDCAAAGEAGSQIEGVAKVLVADAPHYAEMLAEPMAALLAGLADGYAAILAVANTDGKNFMPRLAALKDVSQISEIVEIQGPDTFVRPIYAGNAMATVQSTDALKVITVRTTAFAKAVTAAKSLGDVTVLVAGPAAAGQAASQIDGVAKVVVADDAAYANGLAEPVADLVVSLAGNYEHIVAPSTASAKNILPRVAALLDVMVLSDVTAILDGSTFERPIYAGNAMQTVKSNDSKKLLTVRTTAFDAAGQGGSAAVEAIAAAGNAGLSAWVEDKVAASDRPELTSAKVVVSGGRGVGSEENFAIIEALADKLGAAVGASRAAVDSGFAPNDWQVGQTGKVVAPELYIAVGISGAIQHLAGMKDSKVIVAINKDEEAPIFQIADYGLVADLFDAVPDLTKALKE